MSNERQARTARTALYRRSQAQTETQARANFPDFVGCGSKKYRDDDEWHVDGYYDTYMVQCSQCLNSAYAKGQSKLEAAQKWNAGQYLEFKKWGDAGG